MIYNYNIVAPVVNRRKPFIDKRGFLVIPNMNKKYKYYIEVSRNTNTNFGIEFFILFSNTKFDDNCRSCNVDNYGRLKLKLHGDLNNYVIDEIKDRGNILVEYIESASNFDVFEIK